MPPKQGGGIRQRLGLVGRARGLAPELEDVPPEPPARRGGIRRRVGLVEERGAGEGAGSSHDERPPEMPGRRGGIRRRLNVDEPPLSTSDPSLPLNANMRRSFASGELSATKIESIFRDAAAQGAQSTPKLSSPAYPQNLQRSLMAAFGTPAGAPDIEFRMIPTTLGVIAHPFLFPHRFFASLYASQSAFWTKSVSGPIGAATRFWQRMESSRFVKDHPHLAGVDWATLLPLGMHGDSGKFSHYDSLFVVTFNSCLGEGPTKSTRFLMTAIKKSLIVPGTIDAIARVLGWSFNVLLTGLEPMIDELGNPLPPSDARYLAGGFKGVLVKVRGDWEFYNSVFKVPHWKSLGRMCWLCGAVGDPNNALKYSRTDARSPWRATRVSHQAFLRWCRAEGAGIGSFFMYVEGLIIDCIMIDVLHTVDLGIFAHAMANILWEVIALKPFGTTIEANVDGIKKRLDTYYSEHRVHNKWRGKFKVEKIKTSADWPKLKTQAAVVRDMAGFCTQLAIEFLSRKHLWLCQLMSRFYDLLDDEPVFLSATATDEVKKLGSSFCNLYAEFASQAFDAGIKGWKTSPKLHMFQHLCEWVAPEMGNPRYFWCYADEDMVGKMISAAKSCHPRTLHLMAVWKWLLGYFEQELPPR